MVFQKVEPRTSAEIDRIHRENGCDICMRWDWVRNRCRAFVQEPKDCWAYSDDLECWAKINKAITAYKDSKLGVEPQK